MPRDVSRSEVDANGVRCMWHWPSAYATPEEVPGKLLYVHGGAFCLGSPETHQQLISSIAKRTQVAVLAPDYSRCPESTMSRAVEDILKAYKFLLNLEGEAGSGGAHISNIVIGGESAGANLATTVALRIKSGRDHLPQARALALMSPWINLKDSIEQTNPSWTENEGNDFVLSRLARIFATWVLVAEDEGGISQPDAFKTQARLKMIPLETLAGIAQNPVVSPALAPDLSGLPRTQVLFGGCETLRDSQQQFVDRLREANVAVESEVFPDMPHGIALASFLASARHSGPSDVVARFATFVRKACGEEEEDVVAQKVVGLRTCEVDYPVQPSICAARMGGA